ncbi:MAG: ActS/PrrB/RegB family redox-sensitive histidine kinase [Pseudomonadota bacterium]
MLPRTGRSEWVRLRTLTVLRWIAVIGQLIAVGVASRAFHLQFPVGLCYLVIGTAILANLLAIFFYPENKRLTESEALLMLLFDVAQLSVLLFLTGGLHNPFAILILAPVTIAATALHLRSILILGGVTIASITFVAVAHLPMRTSDGQVLETPLTFVFGFWLAIVIGVAFQAVYTRRVSEEMNAMSDALLATQMALAREQKLTDLGGVVAAAAHELGTPLATIKLVSSELLEDLDGDDLRDDARLIRDQADRCRDILRSMGRAGKDDVHMRTAPISTVVEEAALPHMSRGKALHFDAGPGEGGEARHPMVRRQPEVIHGLRNLIQNAVDFADDDVWIESEWTDNQIVVRISDDGAGYPSHILGRIGDPFVRRRRTDGAASMRPGYEGMGLGLFIAKTLLERTGAELTFANGADPFLEPSEHPERKGAIVEVAWPRERLGAEPRSQAAPLGENQPLAT